MSIKIAGITPLVDLDSPIYQNSHFTWREATRNGRRIPQNTSYGGIIIPAAQITGNIVKLARELDKIRAQFGDRPIHINSWYRPSALNAAVGGRPSSHHLLGWGVDIVIDGYAPPRVTSILAKTWAGGLGDNPMYTHLDLRHLMGLAAVRWDYGVG